MSYIINTKNRTWKEFFFARLFRVAPLYYVLTILVLILGIAEHDAVFNIIRSFLFLSLKTVLPVGWTLTYEFIFYFVCTLIIVFVEKYKLVYISLILIIGNFILATLLNSSNYGNYFLVFIFGIFLYYIYENKFFNNNLFRITTILFTLLFISYLMLLGDDILFTSFIILGLIGLIIISILLYFEYLEVLPSIPVLILLGDASYSIYLTHWIVLEVISLSQIHLFILSIIIGIITYYILEKPLLKVTRNIKI